MSKNKNEETPLLEKEDAPNPGTAFRRTSPGRMGTRASVRGSQAFPFYPPHLLTSPSDDGYKKLVEPVEALSPLVQGRVIHGVDGVEARARPPSLVKSIPAYTPYRRMARHRSFYLNWINEFRHWWKSSRLLVRLGGLETYARDIWMAMIVLSPTSRKSMKHAFKFAKHLGQGGPMRGFLQRCHPFTRSVRILVASWRWVESAQCRRLEVGVEEAMAFMGNRVSRMLARTVVDFFSKGMVLPSTRFVFKRTALPADIFWHPAVLLILLGILRAISPYAASFQGSRVGRVLTRAFFRNSRHRWLPIQRVEDLNLKSDDCCEQDEIDENAVLAKLAKKVAKALGQSQSLGVDGMEFQDAALGQEGFRQVGAGSGGYAVYECHRRVSTSEGTDMHTILLHVTPYGPSILNVMPRYIVLELEGSQDRRAAWSETIDSWRWTGPSLVEGYCYQGAFFSPHHFAELKERYDSQLVSYDNGCKAMTKTRTEPPTDLPTLKKFLENGKIPRKRKKNDREYRELQKQVTKVANRLKGMMKPDGDCRAPEGVILYFEGLDCSGKSSTGGLIEQALEQAGFEVDMRQYNRPPTEEQKRRPWMDRFEVPDTSADAPADAEKGVTDDDKTPKHQGHRHKAMVWDRGPAGDFVYGALATASEDVKKDRYLEFMEFDQECKRKNILFVKLMFVTNRDSIAATLGKRLAQRKMAQDLKTWQKASGGVAEGSLALEGLDLIEIHIDPTDFIAFNMYQKNLYKFVNFAINTDNDANPWIVVNTADRYAARKQLLRVFQAQLDAFSPRPRVCGRICPQICGRPQSAPAPDTPGIAISDMIDKEFPKRMRPRTLVFFLLLLCLVWYYCAHTKFDTFLWQKEDRRR